MDVDAGVRERDRVALRVVELSCVPDPRVVWRIEDRSVVGVPGDPVTLVLRRPDGDALVTGVWRVRHDGWSNGAVIGNGDAPLKRVVTHWFNLPNFHGPIALTRSSEVDDWWLGRWEIEVGGWKLTLDVRPDHAQVWRTRSGIRRTRQSPSRRPGRRTAANGKAGTEPQRRSKPNVGAPCSRSRSVQQGNH